MHMNMQSRLISKTHADRQVHTHKVHHSPSQRLLMLHGDEIFINGKKIP